MDKPAPKTKVCTKCGKRKSLAAFRTRTVRGRSYVVGQCRDCERALSREYGATHRPQRAKYLRELRKKKPEMFKEYDAKKYIAHKPKIRARQNRWAKEKYYSDLPTSRERAKRSSHAYYHRNTAKASEYSKKRVKVLGDGYVAAKLGVKVKDVPPALIEAKRIQLQIKRYLRENNQ